MTRLGSTLAEMIDATAADGGAGVFAALEATAHIAHGAAVDEALIDLASVPGVDRSTIQINPGSARRGRHGAFVVTWTQGGQRRSREGVALTVALERALRQSRAECAKADR